MELVILCLLLAAACRGGARRPTVTMTVEEWTRWDVQQRARTRLRLGIGLVTLLWSVALVVAYTH